MGKKGNRNRVLGDRLWDGEGEEWGHIPPTWLTAADVEQALATGAPAVRYGFDRPMCWLSNGEAVELWPMLRPHFEVPGKRAGFPDHEGLTYAAVRWRRGPDILIGFLEFC